MTDLLSSVRERGIDTKSTYTIFIGGGAILLRRFLESSSRLIKYQFIDDIFCKCERVRHPVPQFFSREVMMWERKIHMYLR